MTSEVRDARPPAALVAILNPIMRALLRSPLGRLVTPLALIEFTGRRSGRRYRIPAGWHHADGRPVVFSPAPWRNNFAETWPATVHHRGRAHQMTGILIDDPKETARALESVIVSGTPPRQVGLAITGNPPRITPADVTKVGRAMIIFRPANAAP